MDELKERMKKEKRLEISTERIEELEGEVRNADKKIMESPRREQTE